MARDTENCRMVFGVFIQDCFSGRMNEKATAVESGYYMLKPISFNLGLQRFVTRFTAFTFE